MSRIPPPSFLAGRDPLPWDDDPYYTNPADHYLDPANHDEYDDFAYERSRPHPQFPQPRFALSPAGSIRTSYQNVQPSNTSYNSQYDSQSSRAYVTPPGQSYSPEHSIHDRVNPFDSPPRSVNSNQRDMSPTRADSPTRMPLTGATAYGGYEMTQKTPEGFDKAPKAAWQKEEQKAISRRKWILWGIVIFIVVGAVVGVVVYFVKFRNTGGGGGGGGGSVDHGSSKGRNGAGSTAGNIQKDSKLKLIFDGMDYTPLNAQYPGCGAIQSNITADVAVLSQLTKQIRLYGTDCNQTEMVLTAIQDLKVDMTVFIGVWVDTNATTLNRQLSDMYSILNNYPASLIDGVAVGNEVLFRQDKTETELIELIKGVRTNITAMNLGKTIPICTSDLGSKWTTTLSAAVDCVMANIHPFFSGVNVTEAADWTFQFLEDNVISTTTALNPAPEIIISEVGWPTGTGSINASVAGTSELQYFLPRFLSAAKKQGVKYYFFEGYDEPWKIMFNTPTEKYEDAWGVLDVDGFIKDGITLPDSV